MKKLLPALIIISALFAFTACGNKDIIDTVYTYDYALVEMPGGEVVKLDIKKWRDYSDGEQCNNNSRRHGLSGEFNQLRFGETEF